MGDIRYRSFLQSAVNDGVTVPTLLVTPDDQRKRLVTGFKGLTQDAGLVYRIQRQGYDAADFDASLQDNTRDYDELNLTFEPGIQIEVDVINNSGSTSDKLAYTLRYELV